MNLIFHSFASVNLKIVFSELPLLEVTLIDLIHSGESSGSIPLAMIPSSAALIESPSRSADRLRTWWMCKSTGVSNDGVSFAETAAYPESCSKLASEFSFPQQLFFSRFNVSFSGFVRLSRLFLQSYLETPFVRQLLFLSLSLHQKLDLQIIRNLILNACDKLQFFQRNPAESNCKNRNQEAARNHASFDTNNLVRSIQNSFLFCVFSLHERSQPWLKKLRLSATN